MTSVDKVNTALQVLVSVNDYIYGIIVTNANSTTQQLVTVAGQMHLLQIT